MQPRKSPGGILCIVCNKEASDAYADLNYIINSVNQFIPTHYLALCDHSDVKWVAALRFDMQSLCYVVKGVRMLLCTSVLGLFFLVWDRTLSSREGKYKWYFRQ